MSKYVPSTTRDDMAGLFELTMELLKPDINCDHMCKSANIHKEAEDRSLRDENSRVADVG